MSYNKETGMYEGYIYLITNVINGKQYIGQTMRTIQDRWKEHKRDCVYCDYALYNAMCAYGVDNFIVKEIDMVYTKTKKEISDILDDREIYWVAFYDTYKNGYNETPGGQYNAPNKFPERSVVEYSIQGAYINTYPSLTAAADATGLSHSDISSCCSRKKIYRVQNKVFRYEDSPLTDDEIIWYRNKYPKISQYNLDGDLINEFEFVIDAVKYLNSIGINADNTNICCCCNGIHHSAYGYVWRYGNDSFDKYQLPWNKKIEQRNYTTGKLIRVFSSFNEIYELYGFDRTCINSCCNGVNSSAYGYHWCYVGEFNEININKRTRNRTVDRYSLDGIYIDSFESVNDAAERGVGKTNAGACSSIRSSCNGIRKNAFNYVWRYGGDPFDYDELMAIISRRNNKTIDL